MSAHTSKYNTYYKIQTYRLQNQIERIENT